MQTAFIVGIQRRKLCKVPWPTFHNCVSVIEADREWRTLHSHLQFFLHFTALVRSLLGQGTETQFTRGLSVCAHHTHTLTHSSVYCLTEVKSSVGCA